VCFILEEKMITASATTASTSPEARLEAMGVVLPSAPGPLGAYAPWVKTGRLLMTSGQFPWADGKLAYEGRIGGDLTAEESYEASRLAGINAIAQLKVAAGSLDKIVRIVRLEGTMQVVSGYRDHPQALDGASDLFNAVFGEAGLHSRMIYTNPEMPLNSPVLIVVFAEMAE
jgi:enamine deaminase RidA (YjgF/YER057c/UK114 family)